MIIITNIYVVQWIRKGDAFYPSIAKIESYSKEAALKKAEMLILPHQILIGNIEIFTVKEYCDSILGELKTIR